MSAKVISLALIFRRLNENHFKQNVNSGIIKPSCNLQCNGKLFTFFNILGLCVLLQALNNEGKLTVTKFVDKRHGESVIIITLLTCLNLPSLQS